VHLVPPLVGFGVLTTNLVEGLVCLWQLQDNTGSSPTFDSVYLPEMIPKNVWGHWRQWWFVKIFTRKIMSWEDIHMKTMECEDIIVSRFPFLLYWVIGTTALLIKWGPSEQSQTNWSDAQPNPMSSSKDNESKSYPELWYVSVVSIIFDCSMPIFYNFYILGNFLYYFWD